jgi:hypothetical protein
VVSAPAAPAPAGAQPGVTHACEFIPIGVFGSAEDGASALAVGSSPAVARRRVVQRYRALAWRNDLA